MEIFGPLIVALAIALLFTPLWIVIFFKYRIPWKMARDAGVPVTYKEIWAMSLRRIPYVQIVKARIAYHESGFEVSVDDLCLHFLQGGNLVMVLEGMQKAKSKNMNLSFEQTCKLDLKDKGVF